MKGIRFRNRRINIYNIYCMNYYETLGVKSDASQDEIRKAYRNLVKAFHPDYYHGDKNFAEEKTRELNKIYEVLGDAEKRKHYDDTHGIHKVTGVSYAFGEFYHTAEGKRKAGVEIPDYYDPDIFYPGYEETGDWYVDALTIYSLPDEADGYRPNLNYAKEPMPESFGIPAEKLPAVRRAYEELCEKERAYIEELRAQSMKYRKPEKLGFSEILCTFLFGPGLLALPAAAVLYYLQTRNTVKLPYYAYLLLIVYGIAAIAFFISQRKTDRKIEEITEETRSYSYKDLPEEMRRYVQYEYMKLEYGNYHSA